MRGYDGEELDRSIEDDLDEYEEEGEDQYEDEVDEEEHEEEEDPKPTKEELEYLELRQRLKEAFRKQMKKESGSALINSQEKKKKLPYDNYGSFFGPSQPVIAQRVIQESKSLLETQHLASKVSHSHHNNKKSFVSTTAGSKPRVHDHPPKVTNELKKKVQKLKDTRDYSFLLSDDAQVPAPTKEPSPRIVSVPNSEARSAQVPLRTKQPLSNAGRQGLTGREGRKPVSTNFQMQPKAGSNKLTSASRPNLTSVDSRKQLGSNNGNGPGRPVVPKGLPSKMPVATVERKASAVVAKNPVASVHKPLSSKMHSSVPKQPLERKKEFQEPSKGKMVPKQVPSSSKPQINRPPKEIASRATLQEHRPKKKPVRKYSDDEDDDEDGRAISMIRKMFGYNPKKYVGRDDDDDSDMEADFHEIEREEKKSARIAAKEDEEELLRIEEEERRERLRKEAKKRKLSQR